VYKIEAAALNMSGGIIPEEPMYVSLLLCVSRHSSDSGSHIADV
jgi:hypothetical protein